MRVLMQWSHAVKSSSPSLDPVCHLLRLGALLRVPHRSLIMGLPSRQSHTLRSLAAPKWAMTHVFSSISGGGLADKISSLDAEVAAIEKGLDHCQSVLSKEFSDWTPLERQMYMNPVKLFEKIERLETELVSLREKAATARRREDVHREQRVALLKQSSAREELLVSMERNVPEIKTLEEFRAIYPAIPWKKVPGNERLTHDAFGMSVDRDEQVFAKILRFFIDREEMFDNIQKHDFRQINRLLCVVGAPGTGKSHVLDYLESKLNSIEVKDVLPRDAEYYGRVKRMLKDSVFISISLNGNTSYRHVEPLNYVLSSRILYTNHINAAALDRYFVRQYSMGLEEFQQSFRCSLYNAIDMVQKASGKRHAFIAVDEVTKVCFDSSDPMTFNYEPFQWLANEVTQHMDVLEGNRVNFVFSSLASIPLIHHEVFWGRKYREFALEQLVSVDKLFKNTTLTDNGKALVKIAGGHSRTLQNVKTVLEKNSQEDRLPELLTLLDREQNKSLDNLEDAKPLLRSSVTGTPVSRRQPLVNYGGVTLTTDEVRAHGFCAFLRVIDEPFRMIPVITPYRLSKYFQKMNEVLGNQFRDSFCSRSDQHNFGGIDFGKFHSSFECFRRMLWTDASLGRVKTASIKDVYQTGETLFSKDFQNTLIRLPETYVLKEALSQTFHEYVESGGSLYGSLQNDQKEGAVIIRFAHTNPGFDSVIITPMAHRKGLHFTFIETRFSMESARKQELLSDIRRKHTLIVKHAVSRLRDALCKDNGGECLEYKWNFVYALYREHDTVKQDNGKRLPPNTILLNRGALNHFYGPSLSGLGMFLKDKRSPDETI